MACEKACVYVKFKITFCFYSMMDNHSLHDISLLHIYKLLAIILYNIHFCKHFF